MENPTMILDHAGNTLSFGLPIHFEVPDLGEGDHKSASKKKTEKRHGRLLGMWRCYGARRGHLSELRHRSTGTQADRRLSRRHACRVRFRRVGTNAIYAFRYAFVVSRIRWYCEHRGWKDGWAFFAFQAKFNQKPPFDWKYTSRSSRAWSSRDGSPLLDSAGKEARGMNATQLPTDPKHNRETEDMTTNQPFSLVANQTRELAGIVAHHERSIRAGLLDPETAADLFGILALDIDRVATLLDAASNLSTAFDQMSLAFNQMSLASNEMLFVINAIKQAIEEQVTETA
jgi:hypothetical protein